MTLLKPCEHLEVELCGGGAIEIREVPQDYDSGTIFVRTEDVPALIAALQQFQPQSE